MTSACNQRQPLRVGFYLEGMAGPGSGTWTRFAALARGLKDAGAQVHVKSPASYSEDVDRLGLASNSTIRDRSKIKRFLYRKNSLETFAHEWNLDILHVEAPPFVGVVNVPTIASIHDLRHFHSSIRNFRSLEEIYQRFILPRQVGSLALIATLSDWATRDIAQTLNFDPQRIVQLPPIVIKPALIDSASRVDRIPSRFALVLGHLEPRKNIETVLLATNDRLWPANFDLVIAGRDNGSEAKLKSLASFGPVKIHFLGPVSENRKWQLLTEASVVLCPSSMEGFGIVAVEASIAGTPALVSNSTALPELAGVPDAIIETYDPREWALAIHRVCSDINFSEAIAAAQKVNRGLFAEDSVINDILNTYRAVQAIYQETRA